MRALLHGLLNFVGGSVTKATGTAIVVGAFFAAFGVLPWELVARWIGEPPAWMMSGWFRLAVLIVGLVIIFAAITYNQWDRRQAVINDLAEDISWAIGDLLNRTPRPQSAAEIAQLQTDFDGWCGRVSTKLGNRAIFTRADQVHFDRLGFVEKVHMGISAGQLHDKVLRELRLKLHRPRDVIHRAQQRRK